MKKQIITIAAVVLMVGNLSAQNDNDTRNLLHVGVKAGMNISNMFDSQNEEYQADPKMGFVGGIFVSIPIIDKTIGIQPEVLYSQKGFSAIGNILGADVSFKRTTNYLDIPIYLAFKPIEYITLLIGPQYSYLFKQRDVFKNPISDIVLESEFENENIRKNTFSFSTGADFNFRNFVFSGRIAWDLFNNNGNGTSSTPRYKNVWGGLTLGIRL
ncbi:MAG: porin family protein [Bacteroidales bacterium]